MEKTKKICIVTLYGNNNYGNKLQNYALQEKLKSYNYEVETVVNNPKYESWKKRTFINYIKFPFSLIKKNIHNLKMLMYQNIEEDRETFFKQFNKDYIKYTDFEIDRYNVPKDLKEKYDFFVIGSDQIWNPYSGMVSEKDFCTFANKSKVLSYAASFGVNTIPHELRQMYYNGLNNINHISVRENDGKDLVADVLGKDIAEVLVDPTMLLTKSEWELIAKKPICHNDKPYILNYFLGNVSDDIMTQIQEFAKKNNLEVINILDKNNKYYKTGPAEFVYLEQHASLICTDSFHSCVFGILLHTPFIVFERNEKSVSMNSRIETLISKFNLNNRKYNGMLDSSYLDYNYTTCDKILKKEREKSDEFLKKALSVK